MGGNHSTLEKNPNSLSFRYSGKFPTASSRPLQKTGFLQVLHYTPSRTLQSCVRLAAKRRVALITVVEACSKLDNAFAFILCGCIHRNECYPYEACIESYHGDGIHQADHSPQLVQLDETC